MKNVGPRQYYVQKDPRLGAVSAMGIKSEYAAQRYLTEETVLVWIAFIGMIVCNAAFETFGLNETTVAEVSSQVFAWFSPATYAFFIWGVIYAAMAVWLVYFTFDAPRRPREMGLDALLFTVSCILNVAWLALFHYEQIGAALVVIVTLWAVLFAQYYPARRRSASAAAWVPWSIYLSWITVASVVNAVNLATRVVGSGSVLLSEASVVVLTAAVLTAAFAVRRLMDDVVFPLVTLWAVVAVGVRMLAESAVLAGLVFVLAGLAALAIYLPTGFFATLAGGGRNARTRV